MLNKGMKLSDGFTDEVFNAFYQKYNKQGWRKIVCVRRG